MPLPGNKTCWSTILYLYLVRFLSAQVITLAACKISRSFLIILITFKAINGLAPAYISELISVRDTGRYDLRSNDGLLLAPYRGKTLSTLGDRSFHAAAPKCGTIFRALSETPNL